MKFKIGDKVRIKRNLNIGSHGMEALEGTSQIINYVGSGKCPYYLEGSSFWWDEWMLEPDNDDESRNILEKPKAGWSEITIGDWTDRCSYLDDVPNLLLDVLTRYMTTGNPQAVELDAEGWEYIIVFNEWETHIISSKNEKFELHSEEVHILTLVSELITDIRHDITEWASWDCVELLDGEISWRKSQLLQKCNNLEKLLILKKKRIGLIDKDEAVKALQALQVIPDDKGENKNE